MSEPIEFFNRYTGAVETEKIYGEKWLRRSYETMPGRLWQGAIARSPAFSQWFGRRMDRPASRAKITPFIEQYDLDPAEFAEPADNFGSFNEFFFRTLKPEARPIAGGEQTAVFPADGRHLGFPQVGREESVFVKGQRFDLAGLLGDADLAERYAGGTLVLSRLCPVDYHRFHFPASGVPAEPRMINGPLYSVSPIALRRNLAYLTENKRVLVPFKTEAFGELLLIPVGATCVGSIELTFTPGEPVGKGAELGFFRFGGSSFITLFPPSSITLETDLRENTATVRELYARMGDRMGERS